MATGGGYVSFVKAIVLLSVLLSHAVSADYYRSKVYLDPNIKLDESTVLSLQELEQQINGMTDAYSKSTTGRYLAHQYVEQKNYAKAIEYYNAALEAGGLSEVVNSQLLKELASIYVIEEQYHQAIATFNRLQENLRVLSASQQLDQQSTPGGMDVDSKILLAQSYFGTQDYLSAVETLDSIPLGSPSTSASQSSRQLEPNANSGKQTPLTEAQLNQMLALYYNAGSYLQSERVLQRLIQLSPKTFNYWRQLTSVFLRQGKRKQALDQLALANQKKLPFGSQDIILLADLYVANQAAAKGARVLEQAMAQGEVEKNEANLQRTFEYWLQARDKEKAANTLKQSISRITDMDLFIRLAQLQMEQSQWKGMNNTMLSACRNVLDDRYVSHANLLLGVSQLKLDDKAAARRSFINATLLGGKGEKARQWLEFMGADAATGDELSEITGPCHPQNRTVRYANITKQPAANPTPDKVKDADSAKPEVASTVTVKTKSIAAQSLYGLKLSVKAEDIAASIKKNAFRAGAALVKSGGSIDGPLHILFDEKLAEGEPLKFRLAFPYKGKPRNKGPYRAKKAAAFKCTYLVYNGPGAGIPDAWGRLIEQTIAAGYTPTGKSRMILMMNTNDPTAEPAYELQLGIE